MPTQPYEPTVDAGGVPARYYPQGYTPPPVTPAPQYGAYPPLPVTGASINVQGQGGAPSFNFNWDQTMQQMYEKLKPFYTKVLETAGGDLDLAKRVIEYTYQSGMRQSSEDYAASKGQEALQFPQEKEAQATKLNQRGVYSSGIANTERTRLSTDQALRDEIVERALKNREESLASSRGFGLEEKQRGYQSGLLDTETKQRQEAAGMTANAYGMKSAEYQAGLSQYQIQQQNKAQSMANSGGGSQSGGSSRGAGMSAEQQWAAFHPGEGQKPVGYNGE